MELQLQAAVFRGRSCATGTRQRHAIGAEKFPGDFQRFKFAAAFTRCIRVGWFGFHNILNHEILGLRKNLFCASFRVFGVFRG